MIFLLVVVKLKNLLVLMADNQVVEASINFKKPH